eukprot:gene387-488_t
MVQKAKQLKVGIRPHMKTHKTLEIGKCQTEESIKKVIVSTLAEAKFFSTIFNDILYAIPIAIGKIPRAAELHSRIDKLHLMVDHPDHIESLVNYRVQNSTLLRKPWSVFLKIDCGYHRAGANPNSSSTVELVESITVGKYKDHFTFEGIYTHSGHSYKCFTTDEIAALARDEATVAGNFGKLLRSRGLPCPIVSIGSTPVCCHLPSDLAELGVNEIHPGNYVFYDLMQVELGNCALENVAVSVLATVISQYPDRNECLIDAGSLALSSDPGCTHLQNRAPGFGTVLGEPNLRVVGVTQEIGKIQSLNGAPIPFEKYPIGSKVRVLPNHSCLTAAMFSNYTVINKNQITGKWIPDKHW